MLKSPWDEGFGAKQEGKPLSDNPYQPGDISAARWAEGWHDLNNHLLGRDEALASIGWFGER